MIIASRNLNECDLNIRDHEGISCLELLNSTISRTSSLYPGKLIGSARASEMIQIQEEDEDTDEIDNNDLLSENPAVSVFTWVCTQHLIPG